MKKSPYDAHATTLVKVSNSFYQSDLDALARARAELASEGLDLGARLLLRAAAQVVSEAELFAAAADQCSLDTAAKPAPREAEAIAERATNFYHECDLAKFDRVVRRLAKAGIPANASYVLRSYLRRLPPAALLAPRLKDYFKRFPQLRSVQRAINRSSLE